MYHCPRSCIIARVLKPTEHGTNTKNMTTEMAMRKNHWISALSLLIFSILASHSSRDSSFVQFLFVKFL